MDGEMENPCGSHCVEYLSYGQGVMQRRLVALHLGLNFCDAPALIAGAQQEVNFVAVAKEPAGQIRADKARASSNKYAFHSMNG